MSTPWLPTTLFLLLILNLSTSWAQTCTPFEKPVKYNLKKGDYPASVLRKFNLNPVFGAKGSMNELLKLNQLKLNDSVSPGTLLTLPVSCKEQLKDFELIPKTEFNELSGNVITANVSSAVTSAPVQTATVLQTPGVVTNSDPVLDIVKSDIPVVQPSEQNTEKKETTQNLSNIVQSQVDQQNKVEIPADVEAAYKNQDNISEALRYRMICDGEWTGTECITRYTAIYAGFGGYNNRYDGVDSSPTTANQLRNGLLLSKLNPAAFFGWNNYWNNNFETILHAELQQSNMLPDVTNVPIENGNKLLTSFSAEARYEIGRWGAGVGFKQFDKLYYIFNFDNLVNGFCNAGTIDTCGVKVYTANTSAFWGDISYLFYQVGKFRFDSQVSFISISSSQVGPITVGSGSGLALDVSVTHDRIKEYLKANLHYGQYTQDTSIEKQNMKEISFSFTYAWKLKDWMLDNTPIDKETFSTPSNNN